MEYANALSLPYRDTIRRHLPSPTLNIVAKDICRRIEQDVGSEGTVLVVGCGEGGEGLSGFSTDFLEENVIGTDIRSTGFTEFLGDIHQLPISSESVDAVICQAVLEHIENIKTAIDELMRILKQSGLLYIDVPFLQGYHALPTDFRRFTTLGLTTIVTNNRKLNTIETGTSKGPTSVMVWMMCEYIAYIFSFGNYNLRKVFSICLRIAMFWMKYIDKILLKTHGFETSSMPIPSAVYWYGRKQ